MNDKSSAKNKKKENKHIKLFVIVFLIVIIFSMVTFDLFRAKRFNKPPLFCIKAIEYEDGSADYYGLGYKVWKDYDEFDNETSFYVSFWFLPKFWNI